MAKCWMAVVLMVWGLMMVHGSAFAEGEEAAGPAGEEAGVENPGDAQRNAMAPNVKHLFTFEKDKQAWWTYQKNATVDLSVAEEGAAGSAGALKISYRYDKGGAYMGAGVKPVHFMGGDPWAAYAGGHFSVWLKASQKTSVRVELRAKDKGSFTVSVKADEKWRRFDIPFSEFKSKGKSFDAEVGDIEQMVIAPSGGKQQRELLVDGITLSKEQLNLEPVTVRVSGRVSDAAGNPLPGAKVSLVQRGQTEALASTTAAADGAYRIEYTTTKQQYRAEPPLDEQFGKDAFIVGAHEGLLVSYNPVKATAEAAVRDVVLHAPRSVVELRVEGNRVLKPDGSDHWLQGVCIDSLEWSARGENVLEAIGIAVDQWKSNAIRLPVHSKFWFGRSDQANDGGQAYRKLVDAAIEEAASRGAHLILDLHRFGAPLDEDVEFWKDAAARYKDHPAVLFELFNEPHGISWELWQKGGDLQKDKSADVNAAENNEKVTAKVSPGMQAVLDAARSTGAKNIVIVAGLDWGYDLSGIMNGYALDDRGGNGIIYSSHIYPWKSDWQGKVLVVAEAHPLFIGEVGCQPNPMPWQKSTEDPNTWGPDMIGLIQKYKMHWTAFSFHPGCGPRAILDWQYTPSPYWGEFVKEALDGKQFEMKRMR